jgi:hypothetical protein
VFSFPANLPMYTTNRPSHDVAFGLLTIHLCFSVPFVLFKLVPMNLFVLLNPIPSWELLSFIQFSTCEAIRVVNSIL